MILAGIFLAAQAYGPILARAPIEAAANPPSSDATAACAHTAPDEIIVCVPTQRVYNQRLTPTPVTTARSEGPGPLHATLGRVDLTASGPPGRYSPSIGLALRIHF